METQSVLCNNCGASLIPNSDTRFLTCGYCNSHLKIKHNGSASFTEILDEIDQKTAHIVKDVQHIKIQNEIERLDREWAVEEKRFMMEDNNGKLYIPDESNSSLQRTLSVLFGIVFMIVCYGIGFSIMIPFGLMFIGYGIYLGAKETKKSRLYTHHKAIYDKKRAELLEQLNPGYVYDIKNTPFD